jgi:hypothetical protein
MPLPLRPIAVPARIEFRGFALPPAPGRSMVVAIQQGGEPARVAAWFRAALGRDPEPARFAAACLAVAPIPWYPCPTTAGGQGPAGQDPAGQDPAGHSGRGGGAYCYRLALGGAGRRALGLQCWRWYGEGIGWQRRCGPLPLQRFLAHFEPRPALPTPPGRPSAGGCR